MKLTAAAKLQHRLDARWKRRRTPPLPDLNKHHRQWGFVNR
jgi:hypothetical protein